MEPLAARLEEGLLWLSLDTPGSDVNVFDLRAARALEDQLTHLSPEVRAVVLSSTKPGSFVNGVGLMMAGAVKVAGDVARLTAPVRAAYRALRDAPVPTIAAIHGSCFGCGVELALQCRHRIAVDDGPTSFYMTEIADYLFVPCFGATQDLPRLVGLDAAIRLIVGGERWSSREAAAGGLVDRVVAPRGSDEAIRAFARDACAGRIPSPRLVGRDVEAAPRARVAVSRWPEPRRRVAERAIALIERGAWEGGAYDDEIVAAEQSVTCAESKAAQGFFFVRQIAAARERRGAVPRPTSLVLAGLPLLGDALARTAPVDFPIVVAPAPKADPTRLLVAATDGPGVDVVLSTGPVPPRASSRTRAWAPFLGSGARLVEIDAEASGDVASALALALARAGFETATTRPRAHFVSERVVAALLAPITRHLAQGGALADADAALREIGIARPISVLARSVGASFASDPVALTDPDAAARLALAFAASLVAVAVQVLELGAVSHPATLDVIARHAIDFPLAHRSLTSFATVERARALMGRRAEIEALAGARTLDRLDDHARGGRDVWQ